MQLLAAEPPSLSNATLSRSMLLILSSGAIRLHYVALRAVVDHSFLLDFWSTDRRLDLVTEMIQFTHNNALQPTVTRTPCKLEPVPNDFASMAGPGAQRGRSSVRSGPDFRH